MQCKYRTVSYLIAILCNMCAANHNIVIARLTGVLWYEKDTEQIKCANKL